jgi:predicted MFS family arabinose efflux permease
MSLPQTLAVPGTAPARGRGTNVGDERATPEVPRLVSRQLAVRMVSVAGCSIGFYLPLSVVPIMAHDHGSATAAGLATVALLVATVLVELLTPTVASWLGLRSTLAAGLFLLGAPALALGVTDSPTEIFVINMVRGAGFALSVVAGGAVTATLIPPARRGQGLAVVGLASGVPGMLALPAGVWVAGRWGFTPVLLLTAAATLLPLATISSLPPGGRDDDPATAPGGVLNLLRDAATRRLTVVFASSAASIGTLVTFLPLAVQGRSFAWVAPASLLGQPAASTAARLLAGRLGDSVGQARLVGPGVLLSLGGAAALTATTVPAAMLGGSIVCGAGFGILQNATLTLMYAHAAPGDEGAVSAIWNAAYDLGMAAGALGAGFVVTAAGYPIAFLAGAFVLLPALALTPPWSRRHAVR